MAKDMASPIKIPETLPVRQISGAINFKIRTSESSSHGPQAEGSSEGHRPKNIASKFLGSCI
jgi:hypothetical protein